MEPNTAVDLRESRRQSDLAECLETLFHEIHQLEAEWRLDDRIALAVRRQGA